MPSRAMRGFGGAASGAAAGSTFGPLGTAIGGGLGALAGLFSGGGRDQMPPLEFSPEAMRSVNFSDIDLKSMNPQLYDKILQNNALMAESAKAYADRRQGLTPSEEMMMNQDMGRSERRLGSMGLLGSSAGEAMLANSAAQMRNQAMERAFNERNSLLGQLQQSQMNNYNQMRQGQGDVLGQMNANRQVALNMDAAKQAQANNQFQNDQAQQQANNQFYSGLLSNGIMGLQNNRMANQSGQMADLYRNDLNHRYGLDLQPQSNNPFSGIGQQWGQFTNWLGG